MTKFKYVKRLSLDFLGPEWKDAFVSVSGFTIRDLKMSMVDIGGVDTKDPKAIAVGLEKTLKLLKERFIEGKGVNEKGELIDITKDDLEELPAEVINRLVSFLSQPSETTTLTPSEM